MTREEAFWAAIGAAPDDGLVRVVFADWMEERVQPDSDCQKCEGTGHYWDGKGMWHGAHEMYRCNQCKGTGFVTDGRADLAAALRATADRVPRSLNEVWGGGWWWNCLDNPSDYNAGSHLSDALFKALSSGEPDSGPHDWWRRYPSAAAAIRDLCNAYIATRIKSEVQA